MSGFDEVSLPLGLGFGTTIGVKIPTRISQLSDGRERRISEPLGARRHYLIGSSIKKLTEIKELIRFFEQRQGARNGFRFRDLSEFSSRDDDQAPTAFDQILGQGDGTNTRFLLKKTNGALSRRIFKPVDQSVRISRGGVVITTGFSIDYVKGHVMFQTPPSSGVEIRAGFYFDTPVRFDQDQLDFSLEQNLTGRLSPLSLSELFFPEHDL